MRVVLQQPELFLLLAVDSYDDLKKTYRGNDANHRTEGELVLEIAAAIAIREETIFVNLS